MELGQKLQEVQTKYELSAWNEIILKTSEQKLIPRSREKNRK